MPKPYVLSNSLTSKQKIDKILKRINDNAVSDRTEANTLLTKVKVAMAEITDPIQHTEFGDSVEVFTKMIQTAAVALNQMGKANEQLIKLVAILQRSGESSGKKANSSEGSLFAALSKLDKPKKAPLDDDEET